VKAVHDLPRVALTLSRLIPAADREAILGDLIEDAAYRRLSGARLTLWVCAQCSTIAAGLTVDRARTAFVVPPIREMAAGFALDGTHAFRGLVDAPWIALAGVVLFFASVATLAAAVEVLIAALFTASGLRTP
jgi:hypothetical protein